MNRPQRIARLCRRVEVVPSGSALPGDSFAELLPVFGLRAKDYPHAGVELSLAGRGRGRLESLHEDPAQAGMLAGKAADPREGTLEDGAGGGRPGGWTVAELLHWFSLALGPSLRAGHRAVSWHQPAA